jgi:hypothetical protein
MTVSLPTHRQLLSSLINAVCQTPPQSSSLPANPSLQASIPPSRRQFLLTLHVLFPTLLLPALDLLDRELVTRLTLMGTGSEEQQGSEDSVYVVKSLASTLKGAQRRKSAAKQHLQSSEGRYIVRLRAWNCTCASFALEAYGGAVRPRPHHSPGKTLAETQGSELFGGLSRDVAEIPCCKHVLACLLSDNWETVLGTRIESRKVTKEELAGVIASI